ncbi:MAG: ComEC/Rec2 family competence protein [Spirochaetes bacterium]|nr:ComEC/Rec2 family competence protein [Spirochaetota bacterium]
MLLEKSDEAIRRYYADLLIMVLVALLFTMLLPLLRNPLPQLPFPAESIVSIQGTLLSDSTPLRNGRFLYTIRVDSATSNTNITASAKGAVKIITRGEYLYRGSVVEVINPRFEEEYDHLKKLYFKSLPLINCRRVVLLKESEQTYYRKKIAKPVFEAIAKIDSSDDGLVTALLTGNRIDLHPLLAEKIRKSGCAHVLALSGMHLGVVTMFVLFLFQKFAGRKKALVAALLFNFFFALFAGMSSPLLRSFVFFSLTTCAKMTGRLVDLPKLFVLSYAITILISPDEAGDLSFKYSFLAMAGIIFYTPYFYRIFLRFFPPFFAGQFGFTMAAQLPSWILSAAFFGEIYFSGIIASIIISFLITVFMLIAFPGVILVLFTDIAVLPVSFLIRAVSWLIHFFADFFAQFPGYKTDSGTVLVLIIINIFVIFLTMFPYVKNDRFKILDFFKRFR